MTAQTGLLSAAKSILEDVTFYLNIIEASVYALPLDILSGSSIGQHTRHIIEFYTCLIEQSNQDSRLINYANRKRDLQIESDPLHASSTIEEIIPVLHKLELSTPCILDCGEHSAEGSQVNSTVGRELIYNIEHTVHHLAIIKIALKSVMPELRLPEHFGVARSTLLHRMEACAR